MNFFRNFKENVNKKVAEMQESKEFLSLVAEQTKPIRRKAYLEQKMRDAIKEGAALAAKDTEKKIQKEKKPEDFGIGNGLADPFKYLDKDKTKSQKEKKWVQT